MCSHTDMGKKIQTDKGAFDLGFDGQRGVHYVSQGDKE